MRFCKQNAGDSANIKYIKTYPNQIIIPPIYAQTVYNVTNAESICYIYTALCSIKYDCIIFHFVNFFRLKN